MLNPTLIREIFEGTQKVAHIITHDHCPDGTASAIILKASALMHYALDVTFLQHGTDAYENLQAEEGMIFCDISPPQKRVQEFVDAGAIVLDHHVTAKETVEAFGDRGIYREGPGISGATLAYDAIYAPMKAAYGYDVTDMSRADERAQTLARLAGIRDTWQRSDPNWQKACEQASLLLFFPNRWWLEDPGYGYLVYEYAGDNRDYPFEIVEVGKVAFQQHLDKVKKACDEAYRFTTARGTRVVVIASTTLTSDAAELVGDEADLVVGFRYAIESGKTKIILSTRSHASFDCAAFCKANGGGGHRAAAGCATLPIGQPYQQLQIMIHDWEAAVSP